MILEIQYSRTKEGCFWANEFVSTHGQPDVWIMDDPNIAYCYWSSATDSIIADSILSLKTHKFVGKVTVGQ